MYNYTCIYVYTWDAWILSHDLVVSMCCRLGRLSVQLAGVPRQFHKHGEITNNQHGDITNHKQLN